jgi:hypothetical protein
MAVAPPIYRTDVFTTYVIFDAGHKWSPVVCPGDSIKTTICAIFRDTIKGAIPADENALPEFFGTGLQHYLVSLVELADEEYGRYGYSQTGVIEKTIPPIDVPDREAYELAKVFNLTDFDRSLFPPGLIFKHQLRLPKGSTASFVSPPNMGRYILRLERGNYYRLDLVVSLLMKGLKGHTPEHMDMGFPDTSQITTYVYRIKLDLTIQRTSDPTFVPSDYEVWGFALFNNIKEKLEH